MTAITRAPFPACEPRLPCAPTRRSTTFFLGVCELLTNQVDVAVADFERAIALGESPFLEEAHFYLAKARLRQGKLSAARDELTRTIETHGRLEDEARQLLAQVDILVARKNEMELGNWGTAGNWGTEEPENLRSTS